MSLSFTHLPTHWNADEADTVIAFLDLLRDLLWDTYGDDITAMLRDADCGHRDEGQFELPFDDPLDF
jgi:hypothetical protein